MRPIRHLLSPSLLPPPYLCLPPIPSSPFLAFDWLALSHPHFSTVTRMHWQPRPLRAISELGCSKFRGSWLRDRGRQWRKGGSGQRNLDASVTNFCLWAPWLLANRSRQTQRKGGSSRWTPSIPLYRWPSPLPIAPYRIKRHPPGDDTSYDALPVLTLLRLPTATLIGCEPMGKEQHDATAIGRGDESSMMRCGVEKLTVVWQRGCISG